MQTSKPQMHPHTNHAPARAACTDTHLCWPPLWRRQTWPWRTAAPPQSTGSSESNAGRPSIARTRDIPKRRFMPAFGRGGNRVPCLAVGARMPPDSGFPGAQNPAWTTRPIVMPLQDQSASWVALSADGFVKLVKYALIHFECHILFNFTSYIGDTDTDIDNHHSKTVSNLSRHLRRLAHSTMRLAIHVVPTRGTTKAQRRDTQPSPHSSASLPPTRASMQTQ